MNKEIIKAIEEILSNDQTAKVKKDGDGNVIVQVETVKTIKRCSSS